MANHMNEQEQFLKDLGNDQNKTVDILEQPLSPTDGSSSKDESAQGATGATGKAEDDDEDVPLKPRNRRERRLMQKWQDERESSIFLAGKLEARNEAARLITEEKDYLKGVERIYGNDSPEAQLATDLLKKAILGAKEDARSEAIAEMRAERQREREETLSANRELDSFVEDIEDTYGVQMTEAHQRGFFQLLQKMSPKDSDGNVVGYADPHAVWEVFQDKIQKKGTTNPAKNLSARSMVQSGASKESTLQDDSNQRVLRELGII